MGVVNAIVVDVVVQATVASIALDRIVEDFIFALALGERAREVISRNRNEEKGEGSFCWVAQVA